MGCLLAAVVLSCRLGAGDSVLTQEPPPPDPAGQTTAPAPAPPPDAAAPPAAAPEGKPPRRRYDDKRRTLRSYGANMRYNFAGPLTRGNHVPLLVTAAITAPAFAWDDEVIDYFGHHPHRHFGTIGQTLGGGIAVGGLSLGVFGAGRIVPYGRFRDASYDLSQAVIITQVYTQVLKLVVRRERPDGSNRVSFPSGHSSNAFTAASVLAHHYGPKLGIPAYGVATYIAVSRLAANKHHFSDIVAGAGFGWGVGRAVFRRNGRPPDVQPGRDKTHVELLPYGGGLSLVVSF